MSGERGGSQALDLALARYKQGKCPCCGKGGGDARGLEYRRGPNDIYCHTCRRRWPLEMDIIELQRELALSVSMETDTPAAVVLDSAPHCDANGSRAEAKWLRRLLGRFVSMR